MLALVLPFSRNIECYLLISRACFMLLLRLSWVTKELKLRKHPVNKTIFFAQLLHPHFNDLQHMNTNMWWFTTKIQGKNKKNKTVTWRSKQFHKSDPPLTLHRTRRGSWFHLHIKAWSNWFDFCRPTADLHTTLQCIQIRYSGNIQCTMFTLGNSYIEAP